MSVKKSRELRFTWQDKDGALIHAQHLREGAGDDEVRLHITTDGAPLTAETFVQEVKPAKTRTRMYASGGDPLATSGLEVAAARRSCDRGCA